MNNENGPVPLATGGAGPKSSAAAKPQNLTADNSGNLTLAALGAALRDHGIHQANENADVWWKSCADRAIDYLASTGHPFTADHVQALIPAADHPCRMGGRFHAAVRAGVIRPVGYVLSERPSRHRGVLRQYVGGDAR